MRLQAKWCGVVVTFRAGNHKNAGLMPMRNEPQALVGDVLVMPPFYSNAKQIPQALVMWQLVKKYYLMALQEEVKSLPVGQNAALLNTLWIKESLNKLS